jgi:hypothetical protein
VNGKKNESGKLLLSRKSTSNAGIGEWANAKKLKYIQILQIFTVLSSDPDPILPSEN